MRERTSKLVAIIGMVSVGIIGTLILTAPYWLLYFRPSYQLGYKEELLSDLRQYLAREDATAVELGTERQEGNGTGLYFYDMISTKDHKKHGELSIDAENGRVMGLGVEWRHGNNSTRRIG